MLKNLNIPSLKEILDLFKPIIKLADNNKWIIILLMLIAMYLIYKCSSATINNKEGFEINQDERYIFKNKDIYDDFYVSIYDILVEDPQKVEGEVSNMIEATKMNKDSKILDVGSGTGHHVGYMDSLGLNVVGLDRSGSMITESKEIYPNAKFIQGNSGDSFQFSSNEFTHISCLYFTLYYMKDKKHFFENCNNWLKDNGYLILHLVDKYNFDPIINAGDPMHIINPQDYVDKRIESSVVEFDEFSYKSKFTILEHSNVAKFTETFKFKESGRVRENEHILYMERQNEIIKMVESTGFVYKNRIDLAEIGYESQFLYVFQNNK